MGLFNPVEFFVTYSSFSFPLSLYHFSLSVSPSDSFFSLPLCHSLCFSFSLSLCRSLCHMHSLSFSAPFSLSLSLSQFFLSPIPHKEKNARFCDEMEKR